MALDGCKLTYFGLAGRGEAARLMLSMSGVNFEDERINFPSWGELKPSTKWGSMPYLTLKDGTVLGQTRAMNRFIAKHCGLYPEDPLVSAQVDEIIDAIEDLPGMINGAGRGLEQAEKEAARRTEVSAEGAAGKLIIKIDGVIGKSFQGFAVGDKMTLADIHTYTTFSHMFSGFFDGLSIDMLAAFPNIQKVRKAVGSDPRVAKHFAEGGVGAKLPESTLSCFKSY